MNFRDLRITWQGNGHGILYWKGIIFIDYKPAGTSVTGEHNANFIKRLGVAAAEKQKGELATGVHLLLVNATVYKFGSTQAGNRGYKFEKVYNIGEKKNHTVQTWPQILLSLCSEI